MDILEAHLVSLKGTGPVPKAKAHILQRMLDITSLHQKITKITASKESLNDFLDKCITAKPKFLQHLNAFTEKNEETKELVGKAKVAEEKRQDRAMNRMAKLGTQTTTAPVSIGGFTVNVTILKDEAPLATKKKDGYKKKAIPKGVRTHVWNEYIGKEKGEGLCYCCGKNMIDKAAFEAGHVVPEVKGGAATPENLRPICGSCNRSMGDTDMRDYAKRHYGRII